MTPDVSIIAIGDEIISGTIVDTNSKWIAAELREIGIRVVRISSVGDEIAAIVSELEHAAKISSIIITTGGIGPTSDDCTRDAIARFFSVDLVQDKAALKKLEDFAKERGRALNENNIRQSFFPKNSRILVNRIGTADSFLCGKLNSGPVTVSLPGVPNEMKELVSTQVIEEIRRFYPELVLPGVASFRCFGRTESYVGSVIEKLGLSSSVRVAYRPQYPVITVTFSDWISDGQAEREEKCKIAREEAINAIGEEFVFSLDANQTFEEALGEILIKNCAMLSTAESCTGGLVGHKIVSNPGSSNYFAGGVVSYSNESKEELLGVSSASLLKFGAVSEEVVREMALGAQQKFKTRFAVSITGVAGPSGGTKEKPVGTVCFAMVDGDEIFSTTKFLPRERSAVRLYSAVYALDLVRRKLCGYSLEWQVV